MLGDWKPLRGSKENCVGAFSRDTLFKQVVEEVQPDLGILLSLCPETYGLTYDEMVSCGLPLVVGPLGAPADRIREWNSGWVLNEMTEQAVLEELTKIASDQEGLIEKRKAAIEAPIRTLPAEMRSYEELYDGSSRRNETELSLSDFFSRFQIGEPESSLGKRLSGAAIDRILVLLEATGMRAPIQRLLQSSLGDKSLSLLKNLRG